MDVNTGNRLKSSDAVAIKKEPGVKSEYEPSLASLPMAPGSAVKKEYGEDKKPVLGNFPKQREKGGRFRRGRGGSSLVHQVDGYHIRAHYGQGKVDFTITKNSPKTRDLNWREIERVMFEKLNRVGFRVEPTQRPNSALRAFCDGGVGNILRFSVQTRNIPPRVAVSTTPGVGSSFAGHAGGLDFAKKGEETKIKLDLEERKPLQAGLELPEATLPQYLPDITSYQIDGKGGFQFQRITGPNTGFIHF